MTRTTSWLLRAVTRSMLDAVLLFLVPTIVTAQTLQIPHLTKYATDLSATFTPDQLQALEQKLESFDRSTSTQIVVLIVPSMGQESLEDVTLRIAEANGIGTREHSNGALLFVAMAERRVRIEVGYGLEGVLPDALAGIIIRHELAPKFREGNYFAGVDAAVDAMMLATKNEYTAPQQRPASRNVGPSVFAVLFFILFAFLRLARFWNPVTRRRGGFWWGGGMSGWGGGGFGGGGSFGGGGFSGGGGSFGGGGASGSW